MLLLALCGPGQTKDDMMGRIALESAHRRVQDVAQLLCQVNVKCTASKASLVLLATLLVGLGPYLGQLGSLDVHLHRHQDVPSLRDVL